VLRLQQAGFERRGGENLQIAAANVAVEYLLEMISPCSVMRIGRSPRRPAAR